MSERLLIRNAALLLTLDPAAGSGPLGAVEGADLLIEDGRIAHLGPAVGLEPEVIDAAGCIVMPGFVDAHDHLWQSLIRGCAPCGNLYEWLDECVFAVAAAGVRAPEVYAAVRLSALGLIDSGVTTALDWSHAFDAAFADANLRALADSGLRYVFGYYGRDRPDVFDAVRAAHAQVDGDRFAALHVCAHPTLEAQAELNALAGLARELGAPFDVHLLENAAQRAEEPLRALANAGAIGPGLVAHHAIHLTDKEIAALGDAGARVSHNPMSNMRLASGVCPVARLRDAGVAIGLGLDGGAGDAPDAFANMRAAVGLQRAVSQDATVYPSPADALRLATLGGAEALGLDAEIGSLTPGKRADLLVLDAAWMNFAPRWDWPSQLVFGGQPRMVRDALVGGEPLKRNGELVGADVAQAVADAEEAARALQERLGR